MLTSANDQDPPRQLARLVRILERFPWLIPTISFVSGVIGFVMVKRGARLARIIAIVALA